MMLIVIGASLTNMLITAAIVKMLVLVGMSATVAIKTMTMTGVVVMIAKSMLVKLGMVITMMAMMAGVRWD